MAIKNLSNQVAGSLVPSSMSGGNTVSDNPALPMTAPGSESVNDYAEITKDHLPEPDIGAHDDFAREIGADGSPGSRPSSDGGPWSAPGGAQGGTWPH